MKKILSALVCSAITLPFILIMGNVTASSPKTIADEPNISLRDAQKQRREDLIMQIKMDAVSGVSGNQIDSKIKELSSMELTVLERCLIDAELLPANRLRSISSSGVEDLEMTLVEMGHHAPGEKWHKQLRQEAEADQRHFVQVAQRLIDFQKDSKNQDTLTD